MNEISTFRIQKDKDNPYVMLNKQFLNDVNLSWQAKGMLSYLLSLPDDWKIYQSELINHTKDKVKCTNSCIKELVDVGYIQRSKIRNEKQQFKGYEYCVSEIPAVSPKAENGKRTSTNNNNTDNDNNMPQNGLHRFGNKFYNNGKRISKAKYQMECTGDLCSVLSNAR